MAAIYLVGILFLVGSCVVAGTLVLYRLLRWLVCYLRSFQKLFWLRIGVGLLLLFAIPLSALAFVKLCITIVAVGPTTILTTLFIVSIVGMVMSFVVLFVLRLLHLLYRFLCWLVCYLRSFQKLFWLRIGVGLLLLFAIPLSALVFVKLCITIVTVGPTRILTTLFIVSIVGMVISFIALVGVRLLHLLYRLFCSLYRLTTAWTRERQKKLILVEMERKVEENDFQQQDSDLEEVELETEETLVHPRVVEEIDVPTVQTEVHLSASHSSTLRRSLRNKRPPDRWVPPSGRTVQMVPHGSFFDHGVRRSGRIAARLAKL
jgi:hypothetical protein